MSSLTKRVDHLYDVRVNHENIGHNTMVEYAVLGTNIGDVEFELTVYW